jgi:hypothetical protein
MLVATTGPVTSSLLSLSTSLATMAAPPTTEVGMCDVCGVLVSAAGDGGALWTLEKVPGRPENDSSFHALLSYKKEILVVCQECEDERRKAAPKSPQEAAARRKAVASEVRKSGARAAAEVCCAPFFSRMHSS